MLEGIPLPATETSEDAHTPPQRTGADADADAEEGARASHERIQLHQFATDVIG